MSWPNDWMDIRPEMDEWLGRVWKPLLNEVARRTLAILARLDEGGWPTRDSPAHAEDC